MPKPKKFDHLPVLKDSQADASRPDAQVWLSASAGAGKTQVLTARVLRLLLSGAEPEAILCLTFTKAGAAEMADRIHERLGAWVTLPDLTLKHDLAYLCGGSNEYTLADARQLFAKVLDARGGGLRIQTIHAFAQTVLAAFPAEAELTVGFRPVEGREEMQLKRQALGELVSRAEREGRMGTIDRLQLLALRIGEDATRRLLDRCAQSPEAMEELGGGDFLSLARRLLSGGIDDIQGWLEANCGDGLCDTIQLTFVRDANAAWMTKAGTPVKDGEKASAVISEWLKADAPGRVEKLASLRSAWLTGKGTFRAKTPDEPGYQSAVEALDEWVAKLLDMKRALDLAPAIAAALELGQEYARVYAETKRAAGVVDFNDMIRATLKLLKEPGIGDWIRYKLDQSIDHILVDEAQDTNAEQWDIVRELSAEFFAGEGTKPDKVRTVFAVGDFKQAIFGFQGTNPEEFAKAGEDFRDYVESSEQTFDDLSINESFRSSQPILDVVDAVMEDVSAETLGLTSALLKHKSARTHSGYVELLPPVRPDTGDDLGEDGDLPAEEDWLAPAELKWAEALAKKVKHWTTGGLKLDKEGRDAEPGDVMILLRSRSELARLIVSRLYEEKVPVAGVDRLRLDAPIAVQDLMACIRFVLQPEDDLSLASLLVSPLVGLTQEELFNWAHGRKVGLWQHLRATRAEADLFVLRELLAMADRTTPYAFLETILSGPIRGRAEMLARLGEEARDPIEELLNAALQFESTNTPSLQLFLDWFCRGEVDIKRDASKRENAVRVMTVHGSKGLQAPIVVLADATSDPDFKHNGDLDWVVEGGFKLPLFRPKKDERFGSLAASAEAQDKRERQEHWRLLYVAMTRAEERLYIGGALKPSQAKEDKVLSDQTWHKRVEAGMRAIGAVEAEDGTLTVYKKGKPESGKTKSETERWDGPLPDWAKRDAPEEARPPRPLAPSALGVADAAASPPPDPAMRAAAERGRILHALFERLPAVRPEDRVAAAKRWLSTQPVEDVDALIADALAVIDHPELAYVFAPDALAEAPLAGVVDGQVIAGTVDRLIVTDTHVTVVDYKTGRRVPSDEAAVPDYHKAQMAAYAAVLGGIFPGREVCAALLYTAGPKLITLSTETLAAWRPGHIAA